MTTPSAIQSWVSADRRLDLTEMSAQLDPDVLLVSPLTDKFTFRGRDQVIGVFEAAFALLSDIEIHNLTGQDTDWVVYGTNTLRRHNLEEIQWLRVGESGLIDHITLFIRPMPAAVALLAAIGPQLHRQGILPRRAAISARAAAPLVAITGLIERLVMPKIGPDPTVPNPRLG